ncbi:hypothetical protein DFR67_12032 [Williamsia limnetica]|uniref:Uncharacterized protein n=1 Tax=Williamsia limnetica TaxID=882452 RepID=A0A318RU04_WILLI|nr:hypothetical protein DFR67_12032 [Williamsia limnetica]
MHEMFNGCVPSHHDNVGHESAVASPPHAFTAHHRGASLGFEEFTNGGRELWCAGMGCVGSELLYSPPGILDHSVGWQATPPSESRIGAVSNTALSHPLSHGIATDIWIVTALIEIPQ